MDSIEKKRFELRKTVLDMVYTAKTGHIGGDFSVMDILIALYYKEMNLSKDNFACAERDRFILSKGHSVESLYAVLCDKGFITKEELKTYSKFKTKLIGHPSSKVNGIELSSGSLGHGLSVGVGMALAAKMDNRSYRVYVVTGDGELAEGSNWEGAMSAGQYKLDNLTVIVDRNRLQISGKTSDVMDTENLRAKFEAFNFFVEEVDGNSLDSLCEKIEKAKRNSGKPTVIIANTVKGYGVSFMENEPSWHHGIPTEKEYEFAKEELERRAQNE